MKKQDERTKRTGTAWKNTIDLPNTKKIQDYFITHWYTEKLVTDRQGAPPAPRCSEKQRVPQTDPDAVFNSQSRTLFCCCAGRFLTKQCVQIRPPLNDFLLHHSLPSLFIVSFLAATILPLGSEWLLATLILQGQPLEEVVLVATLGNFLGACTTYGIGLLGSPFLAKRILGIDETRFSKAIHFYQKYGSWSLLLSWVPIIGDPLCLVSGSFRLNFLLFSLLTFAGKLARYIVVATVTAGNMG
jgi:membrane protein YqaA with SNARE-associated domain